MRKKYIVTLTEAERKQLFSLIRSGKSSARKQMHARVLLKADITEGCPGWTDARIHESLDVAMSTIERVRQRFVEDGLEVALGRRKPNRQYKRILDGDGEAHLIALTCSDPPDGYARWTLSLLAERMIALEYVDKISRDTVQRTLKKTNLSLG